MLSDVSVVVLYEILQEGEVQLYRDLHVAFIQDTHQTWQVRLKAWDQVLITDDGVEGVSGLQGHDFLRAVKGEGLEQEVHDLNKSLLILQE